MSITETEAAETVADEVCASCGTTGGDDVKLKNCTACYLVKYCGVECQRNHWPEHKRACKRRAAELKDELLFKQPESSHLGDCPICLLPIPIDTMHGTARHTTYDCCSGVVCNGCVLANISPETCLLCRQPAPETDEEIDLNLMKRVEVNDPVALHEVGLQRFISGEYEASLEFWEEASRLGDAESQYHISSLYDRGLGVEKDVKKCMHHLEQAAIGGHPTARYNLGVKEWKKGNVDRAMKHFIIAANLGCDSSLVALKSFYARGMVSKEDFGAALRAHYATVNATKSPQRNEAEVAQKAAREAGLM